MDIKEYCVYTHRDMAGKVFYVGMGNRRRPFDLSNSHRSQAWLNHVAAHGLGEINIVEWFDDREEAFAHEAEITELLMGMGVKLANTYIGTRVAEESKKKLSESHIGEKNPMFGKEHSEETKKKMSENSAWNGKFGQDNKNFKGIWIGIRNRDKSVVAFAGKKDIKDRGYSSGAISESARGVYHGRNDYRGFTWSQTLDKEYLKTLLEQDNFVDEESKIVITEFLAY